MRQILFVLVMCGLAGAQNPVERYGTLVGVPTLTSPGPITGATTTLSAGIDATTTSINVTANFSPAVSPPFVLAIDSERFNCSSVGTGLNWTCTRHYDGTAAATHSISATGTHVAWQWVNQGSSTVSTTNSTLYIAATVASGSHSVRLLKKPLPSSGIFSVTAVVRGMIPTKGAGWDGYVGIALRESSSGKLLSCQFGQGSTHMWWGSSTFYWSSPTNLVAGRETENYALSANPQNAMLKVWQPGDGQRYCATSFDAGSTWITYYQAGATVDITADEIGFYVNAYNAAVLSPIHGELVSWSQSW